MFHYWGNDSYYGMLAMFLVYFYDTCMALNVGILQLSVPLQYGSYTILLYFWLHEKLFYFLSGAVQLQDLVFINENEQ